MTTSPCRTVCKLDAAGKVCTGCGRTLDEIAAWATMTDSQRRQVMHRLDTARALAPEALQPTR